MVKTLHFIILELLILKDGKNTDIIANQKCVIMKRHFSVTRCHFKEYESNNVKEKVPLNYGPHKDILLYPPTSTMTREVFGTQ